MAKMKFPKKWVKYVGTTLVDRVKTTPGEEEPGGAVPMPIEEILMEHEEKVRLVTQSFVDEGFVPVSQQMMTARDLITAVIAGQLIPEEQTIAPVTGRVVLAGPGSR